MRVRRRWPCGFVALCLVGSVGVTRAYGEEASAGPPLESDAVAMATALSCPGGLTQSDKPVVLLVHGTGTTAAESWPEGFGKALPNAGFDWCMVQLPGRALGDVQTSAEYVTAAVRDLHHRTGRKVSLIGHSQGAMEIRWAVRWWPDVRAHVEDLITLGGVNRPIGWTKLAFCSTPCVPAAWQFSNGSNFLQALNRVPTPAGPSYTTIRSLSDFAIQPALPESESVGTIDGASNILVQDICPGRHVDHIQLVFDAAAWAIAVDALNHPGAAEPARIDRGACSHVAPPGANPLYTSVAIFTTYINALVPIFVTGATTSAEPPVRAYARNR